MASTPYSNSKVGRFVESAAVLEVAARLLVEGLKKLDDNYESALVALRQSYALERQFGDDAERLCRACAALCRGLARASSPSPPSEAVATIIQALDTLDERNRKLYLPPPTDATTAAAQRAAPPRAHVAAPEGSAEEAARDFLARELLGLGRRLAGGPAVGPGGQPDKSAFAKEVPVSPPPRLDELRAADRAYERLASMAAAGGPLRLGGASHELVISQEELLFQQSQQARAIGLQLARENTARATDAALFYYQRGVRKLRVAGVGERDPHMLALRRLIESAEAQADALKAAGGAPQMPAAHDGADASGGGGGGGADDGDGSSCVVS